MEFKDIKELVIEKLKPKLIVVTYEALDFVRVNHKHAKQYPMLYNLVNDIIAPGINEIQYYSKLSKLMKQFSKMIEVDNRIKTDELLMYDPFMYLDEGYITLDYRPDHGHRKDVSNCIAYHFEKLTSDFKDDIEFKEVEKVVYFSGLYGKEEVIDHANSLETFLVRIYNYDIPNDFITVYSTGSTYKHDSMTAERVQVVLAERNDMAMVINKYLQYPYFACRWRPMMRLSEL